MVISGWASTRDQKRRVGRQLALAARATPARWLSRSRGLDPLEELDRATLAHPKMPGRLTARMPGPHVTHYPQPQIQRIAPAHDRSPDQGESSIAVPVTPPPIPPSGATL